MGDDSSYAATNRGTMDDRVKLENTQEEQTQHTRKILRPKQAFDIQYSCNKSDDTMEDNNSENKRHSKQQVKSRVKHNIFFSKSKNIFNDDEESSTVSNGSKFKDKAKTLLRASKTDEGKVNQKSRKLLSVKALNQSLDHECQIQSKIPIQHIQTNHKRTDVSVMENSLFEPDFPVKIAAPTYKTIERKNQNEAIIDLSYSPSSCERGTQHSLGRYALVAAPTHANASTSLARLNRQARENSRGGLIPEAFLNRVQVHIYDLIHRETILETPWGCNFPIGECFNTINDGMHALGTGAYHAGIEINGIEFAFGSNEIPGQTGVFTCIPKHSPGYQYRTTLDFGEVRTVKKQWIQVPLSSLVSSSDMPENEIFDGLNDEADEDSHSLVAMSEVQAGPLGGRRRGNFVKGRLEAKFQGVSTHLDSLKEKKTKVEYKYREIETLVEGRDLMREMARDYMGTDYDLLRKNCCTFVKDACLRLGVPEHDIPAWFLNLAETGVATEDAVNTVDGYVLSPIRRILSDAHAENAHESFNEDGPGGVEIIAIPQQNTSSPTSVGDMQILLVESGEGVKQRTLVRSISKQGTPIPIRETMSWAY